MYEEKEPRILNVHEAKTHLSRILDEVKGGEEIILAKAGKPYARLIPIEADQARKPGVLAGMTLSDGFFDPLPVDELAVWDAGYRQDVSD